MLAKARKEMILRAVCRGLGHIGATGEELDEGLKTKDSEWEKLRALEQSLWRAETRFDRTLMEKTFAKDFYEIGRSGRIHTRQDCLELSPEPFEALLPLPNFRIRYIASDVAQVTYTSRDDGRRSAA